MSAFFLFFLLKLCKHKSEVQIILHGIGGARHKGGCLPKMRSSRAAVGVADLLQCFSLLLLAFLIM